jgi:hypothetical protein
MKAALRKATPLIAAFLIGTMFVGAAWAVTTKLKGNLVVTGTVTAKNFKFSTPKGAMLNVPGAAFIAEDSVSSDVNHGNYSGEADLNSGASAIAPVELPNGAVVTKVVLWYAPVGSDGDLEIHLESNIPANDHDDMVILNAKASCVTTPCKVSTSSVFAKTINNGFRDYGIFARDNSGTGVTLYRVQIFYKTAAVGPQAAVATDSIGAGGDHNNP